MEDITMTFNGIDFSDLIHIIQVKRNIGNEREITTDSSPVVGENVQRIKTKSKTIEVRFSLASFDFGSIRFVDTNEPSNIRFSDFNKLREKIAGIFSTDQTVKLTFSDEPDRYYNAMVTGAVELEGIQTWYDEGVVTFLIPDGTAHSITYKRVTSDTAREDGKKLVFTVQNNGNQPAYPIIKVNNNANNGYLGIVNKQAAFELGDVDAWESHKEEYKQSETLLDFRGSKINNIFNVAKANVGISNDMAEKFDYRIVWDNQNWGRKHLAIHDNISRIPGTHAGSLTLDIPADSNGERGSLNDYIWWRQIFWAGTVAQYGFIKVIVTDTNNKFLYGVETFKRSMGVKSEYNVLVPKTSTGEGWDFLKRWEFSATHEDSKNPFNKDRGWTDIKRNDDLLDIYWFGSRYQFRVPGLKGRKSGKIHLYIGQIGGHPRLTHTNIDEFMYRKDFVAKTREIPNKYNLGTEVVVDSEKDTVSVNGVMRFSDVVDGSIFPIIPPGQSELEVYYSDFCAQKPTVTIDFEERYL